MKRASFLLLLLTLALVVSTPTYSQQYWNGGQQVSLNIDSLKVCIKFDQGASRDSVIASINRIVTDIVDSFMYDESL